MKTNKNKLVRQMVTTNIHHPTMNPGFYYVGYDGIGRYLPGVGGITYNFNIGDSCMDLVGDHVEPGASTQNPNDKENNAVIALSCIGNEATLTSGPKAGSKGVVVGKHGGVNHTMIHFEQEILNELQIGDRITIKTFGLGYDLENFNARPMNIDPALFEKIHASIPQTGHKLHIPVSHIIPAYLIGAGLGETNAASDFDLMTQDKAKMKELGLDKLRFGDLVGIEDLTCGNGPHYLEHAITIGVIVHSDSYSAGHGPGITPILIGDNKEIDLVKDASSNLKKYI